METGAKAKPGDNVGLVLEKSSFYAEAGRQEADIGSIDIKSADGAVTRKFNVVDVQVHGSYLLHSGTIKEGTIEVGASAECKVDYDRRVG